jgi:putative ABC transport system permease protein
LLALVTIGITQRTGIDFSQYSDAYSSFGYSPVFYPSLSVRQFGMMLLLVVITAFVSALFPARKALQLNPAESLKN